ncbi:DNA repair protein RadA [Myxococcota bacterium]|nr:DNA repair protein RadA [Myxococcota bacterium]
MGATLPTVARPRSVFACTECGAQQPRWLGRCPECSAWSSLVEEQVGSGLSPRDTLGIAEEPQGAGAGTAASPRLLGEIDATSVPRISTGMEEFDRVLGGGLVPGSVVLLGGEPGVGKSTLALQLAAALEGVAPVLYVTGEESPEQLRLRAERLPVLPEKVRVLAETRLSQLAEPWREAAPGIVIIDSIQTLSTERVESAPGSVAQVRDCAAQLANSAKASGSTLLLVGHVTKEGTLAGPRVLEHLVDVVLHFEGDRHHAFRLLRTSKNRFGPTQEVGVFSMTQAGLEAVGNPSELFLSERRAAGSEGAAGAAGPGACILPLLEGSRPILVELQALVAPAGYGTARRTSIGIDDGRLALMLAVLDRRTHLELVSRDVYVNVAGGFKVGEPAADLGLALALASSCLEIPLPPDVAACGEIGLGGEVRRVARLDLRLREAARLGFRRVLVPEGQEIPPGECGDAQPIPVADAAAAVAWLRTCPPVHRPVNGS